MAEKDLQGQLGCVGCAGGDVGHIGDAIVIEVRGDKVAASGEANWDDRGLLELKRPVSYSVEDGEVGPTDEDVLLSVAVEVGCTNIDGARLRKGDREGIERRG